MSFVDPLSTAREIMDDFARSTGLSSDRPPRRYLWTDAFAVCNYLGLHASTGSERYRKLALGLVDQVHRVLGRHREDDPRSGWISGLGEEEGGRHPTAGGLRIGKPLPERAPDEPLDPRKEWDRDGQYYHYLTKWMHALNRVWQVAGEAVHHRWAVELAEAAHEGFVVTGEGRKRLYWKMSIDLSRPLVPSTGQHDPLDGFLTLAALRASAPPEGTGGPGVSEDGLEAEIAELRQMCRGSSWTTDDPLGAGGLLVHALRGHRLASAHALPDGDILRRILEAADSSLQAAVESGSLRGPAGGRLAFRELGLAIGLAAARRLVRQEGNGGRDPAPPLPGSVVATYRDHLPLVERIQEFWTDPSHRDAKTWSQHRDISRIMLATSLAPDGYLGG